MAPSEEPTQAWRRQRARRRRRRVQARLALCAATTGSVASLIIVYDQLVLPGGFLGTLQTALPGMLMVLAISLTGIAAPGTRFTHAQLVLFVCALFTSAAVYVGIHADHHLYEVALTWINVMFWAGLLVARVHPFTSWRFRAGVLIAMATLLGFLVTGTVASPEGRSSGIAFAADKPLPPGLVLNIKVWSGTCRAPTIVTIRVVGTTQFWRRLRKPWPKKLTIAVPYVIKGGMFIADPDQVLSANSTAQEANRLVALMRRRSPSTRPVHLKYLRRGDYTAVEATDRWWAKKHHPLLYLFVVDWKTRRSTGTCYIEVPPHAGNSAVIGPSVVFRSRNRYFTEPAATQLIVSVPSISIAETQPSPQGSLEGEPVWQCTAPRHNARPTREHKNQFPSFPEGMYRRAFSGDCQVAVSVVSPAGGLQRDLSLIVFGAAISLSASLIASVLMGGRQSQSAEVDV